MLDAPKVTIGPGDFDCRRSLHQLFSLISKATREHLILDRPEKPVGIIDNDFRQRPTGVLAEINSTPVHDEKILSN
jgi:hypothetical protein